MIGSNVFGQAQQYQGQAGDIYGGLGSFSPTPMQAAQLAEVERMKAVGQVGDVSAGQLATTNFDPYMSPYTQNVIEMGQADIERQRQMASNQMGAQAQAANAYGGSRQAVQEGVLAGEALRQAGALSAQQRQQAFTQALQSGQLDISGRMQADTLNQQAAEAAAARDQAARAGNMQAANQFAIQQAQFEQAANQANYQGQFQAADIQSGAAGGLRGLGSTMFGQGMSGLQQQQAAAARAQAAQQAMLDASRNQTLANLGYPGQALQTGYETLRGLPGAKVTQPGSPGLFEILGTIGSLPGFG
jgi:hypothetical protein